MGLFSHDIASARIFALRFSAESIIHGASFNTGRVRSLLYKVHAPRWDNNIVSKPSVVVASLILSVRRKFARIAAPRLLCPLPRRSRSPRSWRRRWSSLRRRLLRRLLPRKPLRRRRPPRRLLLRRRRLLLLRLPLRLLRNKQPLCLLFRFLNISSSVPLSGTLFA